MGALREFEIEALRILLAGVVTKEQLAEIETHSGPVGYEYTGSGYYLTVPQLHLPPGRRTCSEPAVTGEAGDVRCGFVAFLDDGNLVLECHSWGEVDVPDGFRELDVRVNVAEVVKIGGQW